MKTKKSTTKLIIISLITVLSAPLGVIAYKYYEKHIHRPYLTVVGYVNMAEGLGRQSAELINAFTDEFSIGMFCTQKNKLQDTSRAVKTIVNTRHSKLGKIVIFEGTLSDPGYRKLIKKFEKDGPLKNQDQIRIAYSMYESTKIPSLWAIVLNTYFDVVVVPDKFLVSVYKNSGVKIPIFVIPLGLDLDNFLQKTLKDKINTPFVFGNLTAYSDRKNQIALIKAFASEFGNNPNVILKINSRYGEKEVRNALTKEITELNVNNIEFTQFSLDQKEYTEMFMGIDCYVSLSKGEGYSIQPREAMALGIPVIVTDNTAQSTICESNLVKVVSSPILKPAVYPTGDHWGYSFDCKNEDVIAAMKDVYFNYSDYLQNSAASREWVKRYHYSNVKPLYSSLIKPKKVILGDKNEITSEFIMTDSVVLYQKYTSLL